ncbi:MAG: LutC/YkgG family protein [Solirubrobacteraceae bacterium]
MSGAREEILARIRRALSDVPGGEQPADVSVPRDYRRQGSADRAQLLARLQDRLRDYGAHCARVAQADIPTAVAAACGELQLRTLVIPAQLPAQWRPGGVQLYEDRDSSTEQLDQVDGVLSGCAVAIAETGTLVLDGQGVCGRRAITLLPDHHICIVRAAQVVAGVPEALERIAPSGRDQRPAVTFISGPSATSDIELQRVEGVHGPRHLRVLIVDEGPAER